MTVAAGLKVSHYNFLVRRDGAHILYNAATGSFIRIRDDVAAALKAKRVPDGLPEDSLAMLMQAGALEDGSQRSGILSRFELQKYNRDHVGFTIAPTIECNYACWYCYQNERRYTGAMTERVQDELVSFIERVTGGAKSFHINWFGGEPLLAVNVIESVSRKVADRLKDKRVRQANSSLITNGLLLNDRTVGILLAAGVTTAQVSIDNLVHRPPTHRGMVLDDGRLSPILENVLKYRHQIDFSLRINVSDMEEADVADMERILRETGLKDRAYLARVENNKEECKSQRPGVVAGMAKRKRFAAVKRDFASSPQEMLDLAQKSLKPRAHFCGATDGSLYVIDFRGDVSRCFFSAGVPEEKIGNVAELAYEVDPALVFDVKSPIDKMWQEFSPSKSVDCKNCRVLPLCMGGCSHARILKGAASPPCESIKYNINRFVREIGTRLPLDA